MTTSSAAGRDAHTWLGGWYTELTGSERRTFWACFSGWALDAMDVQIFSFVVPAIMVSFAITKADAGLIGTVTLITSAFGGWLAGMLADRIGRVATLQVTVLWFAIFSFLCGFAQSYVQLLVLRALMGFGFGGEWAAGAVLMGEVIRAQHRGKAVGCVQSGWAVGWGLAAIASTAFFLLMPQEVAWRALFWIGLAPATLVFFIRRFVNEPALFVAARRQRSETSPCAIFAPNIARTTVLSSILTTGAMGGYYALGTWLPTYLKTERKLSIVGSGAYISVIIIGSFFGFVVGAYLADWIGRRATFILYAVCSVIIILVYTELPITDMTMLVLGFPLGFFAAGIFAGMGPFLTEQFPTPIRASAQGFSYNFGRGIAALNPTFVGLLSASLPLGQSMGVFAVGSYGLMIVAVLLLPETNGRVLTAHS